MITNCTWDEAKHQKKVDRPRVGRCPGQNKLGGGIQSPYRHGCKLKKKWVRNTKRMSPALDSQRSRESCPEWGGKIVIPGSRGVAQRGWK